MSFLNSIFSPAVQGPTLTTAWAKQEQTRLAGLVTRTLQTLSDLQITVDKLAEEQYSEDSVNLLRNLRDDTSFQQISAAATQLLHKVKTSATERLIINSQVPEGTVKEHLNIALNHIMDRILKNDETSLSTRFPRFNSYIHLQRSLN